MFSTFTVPANNYSAYLTFSERKGFLSHSDDTKADDSSAKADAKKDEAKAVKNTKATDTDLPKLSYLRVELDRLRPGMGDFIVRVATPEFEGSKSNTVLNIRGNRALAKYDTVKKLATVIGKEMQSRGDQTHDWDKLDVEHLADLMAGCLKFFAVTTNLDKLQFTTEALM